MNGNAPRHSHAALSPDALTAHRALVEQSGLFDVAGYIRRHPDAAAAGRDPIEHYLTEGWLQGADPGPGFSTHYYLAVNDDVRAAGTNPLVHFIRDGKAEGRRPTPPARRETDADAVPKPAAPDAAEWDRLASTYRPAAVEPLVDVLVPVYRGHDETLRCLFSVLSAAQNTPFRLVCVDDCSPEAHLSAALEGLAERGLIELHRTPENLGFVGACNLGMGLHTARDVVLLNSDAEVFGDWLDRLRAAALRRPNTATVTPLSNNAEICSYPRFVQDNWEQLEVDDAALDRLAARANAGAEVEIPTGVGFCMYVRRTCLDQIGLFDPKNFGKGYGEENDLCRRAVRAGWRNILAPDVFVRHYGATSFGASKAARVVEALRTIEKLHPDYLRLVSDFIARDPVRPFREALDLARLSNRSRRGAVLFVTHGWGGGTERHVQDMASLLETDGIPVFFCRVDPDASGGASGRLHIEDPRTPYTPNLPGFDVARDLQAFADALRRSGVAHVHVHSFAGMPENAPDFIRTACGRAGLAYDVTLHDYMTVCPRLHMVDRSGVYCGEPALEVCETCIGRDGSPFGHPSVWDWRDRFARLLGGARRIFVPDGDVAERMRRFFPHLAFTVRPHPGYAAAPKPSPPPPGTPRPGHGRTRRVAVLGAVGPHKGAALMEDVARYALRLGLPLDFTIIGYTDRDERLKSLGNVTITGAYKREEEAVERLRESEADLVWFSAVCPETFSYTLSIAFEAGVFPVAFDFGAIAGRIRAAGWGHLMPLELLLEPDAVALRLADLTVSPPAEDHAGSHAVARYDDVAQAYYGLGKDLRTPHDSRAA